MAKSSNSGFAGLAEWKPVDNERIRLLERIRERGRAWDDLANQYGVTNPDPPWKITMDVTCDILAGDSCVVAYDDVDRNSCVLPSLERRAEEDDLAATLYADVPFPENQLLALAHSMIKRGIFDENELEQQMGSVEHRLKSV